MDYRIMDVYRTMAYKVAFALKKEEMKKIAGEIPQNESPKELVDWFVDWLCNGNTFEEYQNALIAKLFASKFEIHLIRKGKTMILRVPALDLTAEIQNGEIVEVTFPAFYNEWGDDVENAILDILEYGLGIKLKEEPIPEDPKEILRKAKHILVIQTKMGRSTVYKAVFPHFVIIAIFDNGDYLFVNRASPYWNEKTQTYAMNVYGEDRAFELINSIMENEVYDIWKKVHVIYR